MKPICCRPCRVLAVLLVCAVSPVQLCRGEAAVPAVDLIVGEIADRQSRIQSMRIDLAFEAIPAEGEEQAIKSLGKLELRSGVESYGLKGEKRRIETTVRAVRSATDGGGELGQGGRGGAAAAGPPGGVPNDGPKRIARSFDGEEFRADASLIGVVTPASRVPPNGFQSAYLVNIGLMPQSLANSEGLNAMNSWFGLPSAFEHNPYSVSRDSERGDEILRLDGRVRCTPAGRKSDEAIEYAEDSVWLNASKGYMLVKRELRHGGRLTIRFLNSQPEEVVPGVWLPKLSECQEFAEDQSRPEVINRYTVTDWSFNDIEDSYFRIEFPAGKRVSDSLRGTAENPLAYTIPADPAMLDAVIRRASTSRKAPRYILISISIALAAGLVVLIAARGIHPRRPQA